MTIFEFLEVSVLLLCAGYLFLIEVESRKARTIALCGFIGSLAIAIAKLFLYTPDALTSGSLLSPFLLFLPAIYSLLGISLVGLSSRVKGEVYPGILLLLGASLCLPYLYSYTFIALILWALPTVYISFYLDRESKDSKGFLLYQVPSILSFGFGLYYLSNNQKSLADILLILAVCLRHGFFPFQSWVSRTFIALPDSLALAYLLPQTGIITLLYVNPESVAPFALQMLAISVGLSALYGSLFCHVQKKLRSIYAYFYIAQSAMIVFGLLTHSTIGLTGTIMTLPAMTLALAGFIMSLSCLEARRGSISLVEPSGCYERYPRIAIATLIFGLAASGLPGTLLFLTEELLLQGVAGQYPFGAFVLLCSVALNALIVMKVFYFAFQGSHRHGYEIDYILREVGVVTVLLAVLVCFGIFPGYLLQ